LEFFVREVGRGNGMEERSLEIGEVLVCLINYYPRQNISHAVTHACMHLWIAASFTLCVCGCFAMWINYTWAA